MKISGKYLARLMMLAMIAVVPALSQTEKWEDEIEDGAALKRFQWFYGQRAFPREKLEQGYLLRAFEQDQKNKAAQRYSPNSFFSWTAVGPAPGQVGNYGSVAGRMTGVVVDPTNTNIIYIAAADGGVWKTTDGGTSWTPLTDNQPSLASGSITIDPTNTNVLYYGTGEPYYSIDAYGGVGVLKSTDGGATWFLSGLSGEPRVSGVTVDPTNTATVFAATFGGVYRSTNAGASWTKVLAQARTYDVVINPSNSQYVYASIGNNAGNAGVWKSTDGGSTWSKLGGGLPASGSINVAKLTLCANFPSTLYMLASTGSGNLQGVYRTLDGGTTWTTVSATLPEIFNTQGWYDIALEVSPTDSNLVFAGGIDTWRSTDGGGSWTNVTNGYAGGNVHVDHHDLYFQSGTLYLATDGGLWRTTNNGALWTNLNGNMATIQFYDIATDNMTPARIYGGTQDNGTQRTTGGLVWTDVLGGDGAVSVVDYTTSLIVYGERQNGAHFKSTNGGTSWFSIQSGISGNGPWVTPFIIHPTNHNTLFTTTNAVYKSTNAGSSWTATTGFTANNVNVVAYHPTRNTLYAGTGSFIYKSTNDGTTWTFSSSGIGGTTVTDLEFDPSHNFYVYATLSGTGSGHVYLSTDEGGSWNNVSGDLPDIPANAVKVQPSDPRKIYVATDLGLYVTINGGVNWVKDSGVPNVAVIDLELTSDNYLVAGTHGRSAWKAPLSTSISGVVYNDADGDTSTAGDRTASSNWIARLYSGATLIDSAVTDGSGVYSFGTLGNGTYDLILKPRMGWVAFASFPGTGGTSESRIDSARLQVVINGGQASINNDFLVFNVNTISGIVYDDLMGDGSMDVGSDVPVAGVVVHLSGVSSSTDTTDGNGLFEFRNLFPGAYTVSETVPTGWIPISPASATVSDTLLSGDSVYFEFGNFKLGEVSGVKFRDSNQNGQLDGGEPLFSDWQIVLQSVQASPETTLTQGDGTYSFSNLGPDVYTIKELFPNKGWVQIKPGIPDFYTVTMRSGLDTSGLDFGNYPRDSVKYWTAKMEDWALATDSKGKYKSEKKKAVSVDFKFNLIVPSNNPQLSLEFSMEVAGTITKGKSKLDTLVSSFTGKKVGPLSLAVLQNDTIQIDGHGIKGKLIKVKYSWGTSSKTAVTDFKMNQLRLPKPNLQNLGEEIFYSAGGFFGSGLRIGLGGVHSVVHLKYTDVQKSFNKKGTIHTGNTRCLDKFDTNGKQIDKQQKSLPPDKHFNKLFAEVLALKLNLKASAINNAPNGLGKIVYDNDTGTTAFNGKNIDLIVAQADSFLTSCDTTSPKHATAADYYAVIRLINCAFNGPLDTISFASKLRVVPAKYLADVPYLRPNPNPSGATTIVENNLIFDPTPREYVLYQNYPNPFNPSTTIEVDLPEASFVTINVYNVLGQEVARLVDRELFDEGNNEFVFDGQGLSSGVYFYKIVAQGAEEDAATFINVKRMVLLK